MNVKEVSKVFGSLTKAQEIILLLHDAKPVIRQGFYEHELEAIEEFCRRNRLFFSKSAFKVLLDDKNIYSNKGIQIPEHDPRPGMFFVYISKEELKSWLANYFELMDNHQGLGTLLGYPDCCIDFFCRNFSPTKTDLQLPSTNPYTNLSKREDDLVLLSHFPCSSECNKSIVLAKNYLKILKTIDKQRAEEVLMSLQRD